MFERQEKSPKVLGAPSVLTSAVIHILFFALCFWAAIPMKEKKTVIPIDVTVVVQENLDGNEDEPPPVEPPPPKPPEPKPEPKPQPKPEPKPEPQKPPDAVIKETPKTNDVVKVQEKKPEPPKPKEKTREDRLKEIRESLSAVKSEKPVQQKPQPNGRTGKKTLSDAEIAKLLASGARAGRTEQLAPDEATRCISLIYRTFYEKWVSPPYSPSLSAMQLEVRFDSGGRVVSTRLIRGSGDAAADRSVREVGNVVKYVAGLSPEFLRANPVVTVSFEVKPQ